MLRGSTQKVNAYLKLRCVDDNKADDPEGMHRKASLAP
jgi:hypothetical protein